MTNFTAGDVLTAANLNAAVHTVPINAQTGTSYTLVLTDGQAKVVTMTNAAANTLTVPANASVAFAVGTYITVVQGGAGQTTISAAGGVTLQSYAGALKISGQYAGAALIKTATDTWLVIGGLSA